MSHFVLGWVCLVVGFVAGSLWGGYATEKRILRKGR